LGAIDRSRRLSSAARQVRDDAHLCRNGAKRRVDIRSFVDTLEHTQLRSFLDKTVRDGVIRRMIDKWLKADVLEEGRVWHPEERTPQGGFVRPRTHASRRMKVPSGQVFI
jgi:retron-type reverse transcriptase